MSRSRLGILLACLATLAILAPLAWLWQASLVPSSYSVMAMGVVDHGGGAEPLAGHHVPGEHSGHGTTGAADTGDSGATISVADLVADEERKADVRTELVAARGDITLQSGRVVRGYTLNGTSPGPTIEATQGDLVEVTVRNQSVDEGLTLHWHGVDVPNAEDGVAGVTQDAVGSSGPSWSGRTTVRTAPSLTRWRSPTPTRAPARSTATRVT